MRKIFLLYFVLLLWLAACEADPTLEPDPLAATTVVSTHIAQATALPNRTTIPDATPAASRVPPTSQPDVSIVIAGVGAPTREITALPEFLSRALYDSLLRVNPQNGDLIPGLAEQWLVSEDAKTFVFVLREDVKWHDGTPLTADDIVFTLQTLSSPTIRINPAADFGPIEKISAPDARTVSITFREPYCAALTYIGLVNILPRHILDQKALVNVAPADLIGTGPLVLKSWTDNEITFTRNAAYWNGAPQILNWTYKIFPDEITARTAQARGQADVVTTLHRAENQIAVRPLNEFFALAFNVRRAPFDNVQVRQALAAGIDRAAVIPDEYEGAATLLQTSALPTFWAAPQNIQQPAFDVQRAQQLLATAGWRDTDGDGVLDQDGKPFEVTLWAQADQARSEFVAQTLRAQLAQIGVHAELKMTDRILFLTRVFLGEYDLALVHFNLPLDPDQHYFWATGEDKPGFGLNVSGYRDAGVDAALGVGNRVARCDAQARKSAYAPVFQKIAQDTPMLFLFAPPEYVVADARVQGMAPSSFAGDYWNLNQWEVQP